MARGATYSDEIKAQVMAALLAGQSISSVAREYSIPKGTVSDWHKRARGVGLEPTQKEGTAIDVLLRQYLEANLETLREQTKVFRDEKWLRRQGASELAVLHGVLTDKAVRILEAFGGNEEAEL